MGRDGLAAGINTMTALGADEFSRRKAEQQRQRELADTRADAISAFERKLKQIGLEDALMRGTVQANPDALLSGEGPAFIPGSGVPRASQPKTNVQTIINKLPLAHGGLTSEGIPKNVMDDPVYLGQAVPNAGQNPGVRGFIDKLPRSPLTGTGTLLGGLVNRATGNRGGIDPETGEKTQEEFGFGANFSARNLLSDISSKIQQDPTIIDSPAVRNLFEASPELRNFEPQLRLLAQSIAQQQQGGQFGSFQTGLSDPIARRIEELRLQGMPDYEIRQFLIEKGLNPGAYGL